MLAVRIGSDECALEDEDAVVAVETEPLADAAISCLSNSHDPSEDKQPGVVVRPEAQLTYRSEDQPIVRDSKDPGKQKTQRLHGNSVQMTEGINGFLGSLLCP